MWLICQQYAEGRGGKSLSLSLVCSFSSWIVCVRACAHVCAHGACANGVAVVGLLCDTQGTGFAHCLALLLPHRLQCQVAWSCALPREVTGAQAARDIPTKARAMEATVEPGWLGRGRRPLPAAQLPPAGQHCRQASPHNALQRCSCDFWQRPWPLLSGGARVSESSGSSNVAES